MILRRRSSIQRAIPEAGSNVSMVPNTPGREDRRIHSAGPVETLGDIEKAPKPLEPPRSATWKAISRIMSSMEQ